MAKVHAFREFRGDRTLDAAAKVIGVNKTTLLRWEEGVVKVPPERVLEVERITGISRHQLRPDLSSIFRDPDRRASTLPIFLQTPGTEP